jgi:predicted acyltransferase
MAPDPRRLAALDQFRGYTVLGMFLVNFVGSFAVVRADLPLLAHHHTYCGYADTIMPQFLFAVGFAYRLTFLRRRAADGPAAAYGHAARRTAALALVAFAVHNVGSNWQTWHAADQLHAVLLRWAKQDFFQTLGHIAATCLWVLPVIAARPGVRVAFAVASGALHLALSYVAYYRWVNTPPNGVDGGPLGFLTWCVPLLVGSLAHDLVTTAADKGKAVRVLLAYGVAVMLLAYGLSCLRLAPMDQDYGAFAVTVAATEPPLVHVDAKPPTNNLFTMSQRSGGVTYPLFGAGFSLAVLAVFVVACDIGGRQVGVFRTLGSNALAGYVIHGLVNAAVKPFVPRDAPLWYVAAGLTVSLALCYLFVRYLERQKLFLKL